MTLASGVAGGPAGPAADALPLSRFRSEFPIFRDRIYLNTCSLGPLGERARRRLAGFLDTWQARGAAAWYEIWWAALAELRARYARLIGAAEGSIALHPNISVALTAVAESLDYRRRPKVVVTSLDFPTVAYQWLARAGEGIEVVVVESPDGIGVPVEAIARAVDDRTALVATSHVYFTSGAIQDVRGAGRGGAPEGRAAAGGRLPGGRPASRWTCGRSTWTSTAAAASSGCSAARASRSCMRGPSCWPDARARGRAAGSRTASSSGSIPARSSSTTTRGGSRPARPPLHAGLRPARRARAASRSSASREIRRAHHGAGRGSDRARPRGRAPAAGWPPTPEARTAIVMLPSADPPAAVRRLAEAGIVADSRPGHVRVSPYFYNVPDDHRAAIERLTS